MKILWVKSDFLHPTERGGQIRTLETLRRLHQRNEVHYVAYGNPAYPEGPQRASEYSSKAYPVEHPIPPRRSVHFLRQAAANLFEDLPLFLSRYHSSVMEQTIRDVRSRVAFDVVVCDFLTMAVNFADVRDCVLFQHNVEYTIWRRMAQHAGNPLSRRYFHNQFQRIYDCEKTACEQAAHVIAVSHVDSDLMQSEFGVKRISVVDTGVDVDYFAPRESEQLADLVFVGAMDWLPNIDGMQYFVAEILPLIRKRRPETSVVIAGRNPGPNIWGLAQADPLITVTGSVPDVRPYLWGSKLSIVPLRVGGGTRLKIYESMAAGKPVVSTAVGAEGLDVNDGADIYLADEPQTFADRCLELLENSTRRRQMGEFALAHSAKFSWDHLSLKFEEILRNAQVGAR